MTENGPVGEKQEQTVKDYKIKLSMDAREILLIVPSKAM